QRVHRSPAADRVFPGSVFRTAPRPSLSWASAGSAPCSWDSGHKRRYRWMSCRSSRTGGDRAARIDIAVATTPAVLEETIPVGPPPAARAETFWQTLHRRAHGTPRPLSGRAERRRKLDAGASLAARPETSYGSDSSSLSHLEQGP